MIQSAPDIHAERQSLLNELMAEHDVDLLLASPSADLYYLIGYSGHASERPTLLALRRFGTPFVLIGRLEAPRLLDRSIEIVAVPDDADPYAALAGALSGVPSARIAITDQTWGGVVLALQATFPSATFVSAGPILRQLRMIKSREELELLARAGLLADKAIAELLSLPFTGRTEQEIARELTAIARARGLEDSGWGPNVATGQNSASAHHMTSARVIHEGDAVVVDFGGALDGYQADITRTLHVGSPTDEFIRVYDTVRRAQEAGVAAVGPGVRSEAVDGAARDVIDSAGYGAFFVHRTGHGIGLECHEEPYIVAGNALRLQPGMTFSVEPGIYLPDQFGVRIEDIVAVTENGVARFNQASRGLAIVQ